MSTRRRGANPSFERIAHLARLPHTHNDGGAGSGKQIEDGPVDSWTDCASDRHALAPRDRPEILLSPYLYCASRLAISQE